MRIVGMFLLGLGIVLLVPSGIALGNAAGLAEVVGFLVCTGLVPVPMIVGGIVIIRRVEDKTARRIEKPEPGAVVKVGEDPISPILQRARGFELNRLNWVGWLLLLATFGFVIAEAAAWVLFLGNDVWGGRVGTRLIGLVGLLLAIGFFAGLRWVLRMLGVSIYRW